MILITYLRRIAFMKMPLIVVALAGIAFALYRDNASAHVVAETARDMPDGQSLFGSARTAWRRMSHPDLLDYDVLVVTTSNSVRHSEHYVGQLQSASGDFRVGKFSQAETQNPSVPHGVNVPYSFVIGIKSGKTPVGGTGSGVPIGLSGITNPEKPSERFGIPELSPLYSFGIRPCGRPRSGSSGSDVGLKTIGTVGTMSRRYLITVLGQDVVAEKPAVHLSLAALVDPRRDRLRDVWLDPLSNNVLQARILGNFADKGNSDVPWLIRFQIIVDATFIDSEIAEAPVHRGRSVFDSVGITFANIRRNPGSPAISFAIPADSSGANVIEEPPELAGMIPGC